MAFERIELNICPAGDMPVFHCSQYDVGRPIIIDLKNGDDAFTPTAGTKFELHCRKVDDNIVTLDTYEVDGNTLTFTSTEQLCACPGDNLCEVAIYLDELCMGTLNFMLHVEPDPLAGGLESETQIYNLTEQVEEITEQVIGDDYYDKTEVDDLLDTKADAATTYTKTEVDTALNLKADRSTTYTKTETNNLLAGKADASDTYSKAQVDSKLSLKADKSTTYTKTQVDDALALKANSADLATVATTGDYDDLLNKPTIPAAQVQSDYAQEDNTKVDYIKNKPDINGMINNAILEIMPVDTASGPIATFNTELAVPLVNVSCNVVATGGNGTPDSPIPVNGYTEANITRCGVNLIDDSIRDFNGGAISFSSSTYGKTLWLPAGTYTLSVVTADGTPTNLYGKNLDTGETIITQYSVFSNTFTLVTACNAAFWVYKAGYTSVNDIISAQIELGSTATAYAPYNGQTYAIAFGQTVYGGVLDVTRGKLRVTHFGEVFDGSNDENWGLQSINSYNIANFYIRLNKVWADSEVSICDRFTVQTTLISDTTTEGYLLSMPDTFYLRVNSSRASTTAELKTWLESNNVKIVYKLATPFDIDLTPVQIRALVGENNVYSDTNGNTTVKFKDSIQHYIDTKVGS